MSVEVTFPGPLVLRAAGEDQQPTTPVPEWGVYADSCWAGWPGIVLDWPDFGVPANDEEAISALLEAVARARAEQDVLVGCLGGIGRTGTILAGAAVATGVPPDRAVEWVRARYDPEAVEKERQRVWVEGPFADDTRVQRSGQKSRDRCIKKVLARLQTETGSALAAGDPLPSLAWAIPRVLAVTQRPLRAHPQYGGSRRDYPSDARRAIDAWITDLCRQGIRSVIVLTSDRELRHYDAPAAKDGGLLELYRRVGLRVEHFPADDPAHDVTAAAAFEGAVDVIALKVADALTEIALPAILQCSAAIDRSPPVAARVAFLHETDYF